MCRLNTSKSQATESGFRCSLQDTNRHFACIQIQGVQKSAKSESALRGSGPSKDFASDLNGPRTSTDDLVGKVKPASPMLSAAKKATQNGGLKLSARSASGRSTPASGLRTPQVSITHLILPCRSLPLTVLKMTSSVLFPSLSLCTS